MMKLLRLAYSNASFIVGLITGAAGLASNLASIFGIELNGFPGILIGYYRTLVAQLFFWSPDWWPEWLSHLITLYVALGLSLARAAVSISKPTAIIRTMLTHLVFWPIQLITMLINKHKHDLSAKMGEHHIRDFRAGIDYGMSGSGMMMMWDYEYGQVEEQQKSLSAARYIQEIIIVASLTPIFAIFLLAWSGLEHQLGI
jgi:hypothetical protein